MDELAIFLQRAGHGVTTVATSPGGRAVEQDERGQRILLRALAPRWMERLRLGREHLFPLAAWRTLRGLEADVVHSFGYTDALAVHWAGRWGGARRILQMNGAPVPAAYHRRFPPERWMIRRAFEVVDQVVACSDFVRTLLLEHYGVDALVEPPGVNLERFPLGEGPRDGRPTILSVANFDVPRKGLRVLVEAFRLVKEEIPEAVLRLSGQLSAAREEEILGPLPSRIRRDVELLGLGRPEDVPPQYRGASVTVLPSMLEPSGTVMVESWASGTPVVASRHGGLPEFFTEGAGALVDPGSDREEPTDAAAFASAIVEVLPDGHRREVREACRRHARRWAWDAVIRRVERIYEA